MSDRVYDVALIGCGNIAFGYNASLQRPGIHTHASAIKASQRLRVTAVCDADSERARACADFCETQATYPSVRKLLDQENVDIVAICTPDPTHAELALDILDDPSFKALMIEKPIALSSADAERVAAKAKNVPVAINYNRRYLPVLASLKEMLGEVIAINGYYTKGVRHNGSHWFDLADCFCGPLASVRAQDSIGSGGNDPTLDVWMEFSNGASGFLKGCSAHAYTIFEMDILSEGGRVRFFDSGYQAEIWEAGESPSHQGARELIHRETISTGLDRSLPVLWSDLVNCLDHGTTPISSVSNAARVVRVADAAIEAARARTSVAL